MDIDKPLQDRVVPHGRILGFPIRQPKNTRHSVAYELGRCFQLDREHCLLAASMDEQGGGDKCVGNHGFIFKDLDDISPEGPIELNWPEPDYQLMNGTGSAFLAKFPITGGFMPRGAKQQDGTPCPGQGTGIFFSSAMTFNPDGSSGDESSELLVETMQVEWDGKELKVTERDLTDTILGFRIVGGPINCFLADRDGFLAPFTTEQGIVVFRFEHNGDQWEAVEAGTPFYTHVDEGILNVRGEFEPSIQKVGDTCFIHTRGSDPVGRIYASKDGLDYRLVSQRYNNLVPQVLNQGLDGSLYIATNPNLDMLRNPLLAYPLVEGSFGIPNYVAEPAIIHDQGGIRDCGGESIPFVDHAIAVNLFLNGQWRHLLWYRVCDLKERGLHCHMSDAAEEIYGRDGKPTERNAIGGLYLVEVEYDDTAAAPFAW